MLLFRIVSAEQAVGIKRAERWAPTSLVVGPFVSWPPRKLRAELGTAAGLPAEFADKPLTAA